MLTITSNSAEFTNKWSCTFTFPIRLTGVLIYKQNMKLCNRIEVLWTNHCWSGEFHKRYIFWVWVCSLTYPARNAHAPNCNLWSVRLYNIFPHYLINTGFGGLEVACWPLVPKFEGSNPAKAVGFLRAKNPQHAFLRRGSKAVRPMSQICGM